MRRWTVVALTVVASTAASSATAPGSPALPACAAESVLPWNSSHVLHLQTSQRPQFEAVVNRVRVDVIVTDNEGNFVDDLRPEELTLFEDGVEQQIQQVQLVNLDAGFVRALSATRPEAQEQIDTEGVDPELETAASSDSSIAAGDFGAMIYVLEVGRLGYRERRRFLEGWAHLLEQTESYGFPRAVYLIDWLGSLRELAPLTYDVEVLRDVSDELLNAVYSPDHPDWGTAHFEPLLAQSLPRRVSSARTAGVLEAVCNSLMGRQGRKALVWVSEGAHLSYRGMPMLVALDAWEALQRAANGANVSIYGLDPTLVTKRHAFRGWVGVTGRQGPWERTIRDPFETKFTDFDERRDSLILASNETAGRAYPYNTAVGSVLQEIETDTAHFYLLTYETPEPHGDGRFHEVRVEVTRPDLEVRARRGYVDHSEEARRNLVAASSLALPGSVADIPLSVGAFSTWTEDGEPEIQVAIDLQSVIEALDQPTATQSLQLYLAAVGDGGDLLDHAKQTVSWETDAVPSGKAGQRPPSTYLYPWLLGYGSFELRVLVIDDRSGRLGTARVTLDMPEPSSELRISHPILIRKSWGDTGPFQPALEGVVDRGSDATVFFEIYGDFELDVSGWIEQATGPHDPTLERAGSGRIDLEIDITQASDSLIQKIWLPVPLDLPLGLYDIVVMVADPAGKGTQVFELPITVI